MAGGWGGGGGNVGWEQGVETSAGTSGGAEGNVGGGRGEGKLQEGAEWGGQHRARMGGADVVACEVILRAEPVQAWQQGRCAKETHGQT